MGALQTLYIYICFQTNKCHLGSSDKAVQTRYKMLFQDVTTT
jgi:hypothetical protein